MKIAICDDEKELREEIKSMSVQFMNNSNIACGIDTFEDFKSFYIKNKDYDLVFLDYSIPGDDDGIEFAKKLRQENKNIFIVFLTSFPEHVFESFSLNTFRYLVKPINESVLNETLSSFVTIYQTDRKIFVSFGDQNFCYNVDDVIYIEAQRRYTEITTTAGKQRSNKGISAYESEINNPHFFRTHRSFIVNMKYVSNFNHKDITLTNGDWVPISPKRYDAFEQSYFSYLKYKV